MTVCVSTSSQSMTPPTNDLSNRSCPDPGCGASVLLMTAQNQCSNCEEKFCNKIYTNTRHAVMEKSKYFLQIYTEFSINLLCLFMSFNFSNLTSDSRVALLPENEIFVKYLGLFSDLVTTQTI